MNMLIQIAFRKSSILLVVFVMVGCNSTNNSANFCQRWSKLDEDTRRQIVYDSAMDFAKTGNNDAALIRCVQEKTDEFVKRDGAYYLCESKDDFFAGRILGQAEATSYALCLQEKNK
jgi:hypothetical protein